MAITFKNPIKICFSNKKYAFSIQTHISKNGNSKFLIEKQVLIGNAITIGVFNQLNSFCSALVHNKILDKCLPIYTNY